MSENEILKQCVEPLLAFYDRGRRILPWREEPTPYHVWVSEIMLQQTRVEAVKPYYDRFMKALPDIRSLSQAEEEKLLKLWEGLGYYNRVRNMKKQRKYWLTGMAVKWFLPMKVSFPCRESVAIQREPSAPLRSESKDLQ